VEKHLHQILYDEPTVDYNQDNKAQIEQPCVTLLQYCHAQTPDCIDSRIGFRQRVNGCRIQNRKKEAY
jgi:hypothetical protein